MSEERRLERVNKGDNFPVWNETKEGDIEYLSVQNVKRQRDQIILEYSENHILGQTWTVGIPTEFGEREFRFLLANKDSKKRRMTVKLIGEA